MELDPCVIFSSGIGMVGKTSTMKEFCKLVRNAFYIDKDTMNPANLHVATRHFPRLLKFEDYVANAGIFPDHARKVQTPFGEMLQLDPTDDTGMNSEFYGRHIRDQIYLIQTAIAKDNLELRKIPIIDCIVMRQIIDGTLQRFKDCKEFEGYQKYHFHFIVDEEIGYQRYLERLGRADSYDSKRYPMNKRLSRDEFHHFVTEEQPMIPRELERYEHLKVDTSHENPRKCAEKCIDYIIEKCDDEIFY